MRIAIDGRELAGHATGVGRYLAEVLRAWNDLPEAHAHEFVVCAHAPLTLPALPRLRLSSVMTPGAGGTWWEQTALPRLLHEARPDVVFAPAYTAPLRCRVPVVLTIHDVSFCAHPEWFSWREGTRRRTLTGLAARRAARVLTDSQFSRDEIVQRLGVAADRVQAIYPGSSGLAPRVRPAPTTPTGHLVLFVGSILARRHVPELVEGFARLARRRPDVDLAIVGEARGVPAVDVAALVRATGVESRIQVRGFVTDDELADLYGRAAAFAFLSSYEGFGLTPLDAIEAQVPTVVLDTAVAREIYGPAAHYVTTPDPALVEAALERVLFDASERMRLTEAGQARLARYSWPACARQTLDAVVGAAS
jgi:glycosyltransferase involved in cell wall biosynthesis